MKKWLLLSSLLLAVQTPSLVHSAPAPEGDSKAAPGFSLEGREGLVVLDSLRGKTVLLDFWASWCEPCRRSFPWMSAMHEKYAPKGLVIVAVNLDKKRRAAEAFLSKFSPPFQVAFDPNGKTAEDYNVSAMPSSFLISPEGKVVHVQAGFDPADSHKLEALIQEAIAK
jgi:cytochrome c biogenesis protein CcmG, thiol:disulfide interchange protein DsbE